MARATGEGTGRIRAPRWMRRGIDAIEQDRRLDAASRALSPIAGALGRGQAGDVLHGRWLGHALHPLLTDIPIGCWTSASILDLVGGRRARPAAQQLLAFGIVSAVPTVASGLADWHTLDDPRARRVGVVHAGGNAIATVCYLSSWRSRRNGHHLRGVIQALVGGGVATVTGYLGGHLVLARQAGVGERGLEPDTGQLLLDLTPADEAAGATPLRAAGGDSRGETVGQGPAYGDHSGSVIANPSGVPQLLRNETS